MTTSSGVSSNQVDYSELINDALVYAFKKAQLFERLYDSTTLLKGIPYMLTLDVVEVDRF